MLRTQLIRSDAVTILTPLGAGQALYRYLLADRSADEIKQGILRLKTQHLDPMIKWVEKKQTRIKQEMDAWREAVRIPVVGVEGEPDPTFTLINLITAQIAINGLAQLRDHLSGFVISAQEGIQGLQL